MHSTRINKKQAEYSDALKRGVIKRVSLAAMILNAALFAATITIGIIYDSLPVISDALHTLSDVLASTLVLAAAAASTSRADAKHNYGHEKLEPVITKILAFLLAVTGAYLLYQGIASLVKPEIREINLALIIVTAAGIAVQEVMFHVANTYAKKVDSIALKADAWHHRSDALSSVAVLLGLILAKYTAIPYFEGAAVIIVAVLILKVAVEIFVSSANQVIDKAVPEKDLEGITKIITETPGVERIDDLKTRISGAAVYVDAEIAVDSGLDVTSAHEIAEAVHLSLEASEYKIKHCTVHVNPMEAGGGKAAANDE